MSQCTFDVHVQEILGTLINGATILMLHPGGFMDFEYLCTVLSEKQVTYMDNVPSFFQSFFEFVEENNTQNMLVYLKLVCSGGMYYTDNIVYF